MSRPRRQDFAEAIHLIRIEGGAPAPIFFEAEHVTLDTSRIPSLLRWEHLIARACDRNGACVHAFKWLPNVAVFLLQRFSVPLDRMLATILGQYSRSLHSAGLVARSASPYRSRYKSLVIAPAALPYAVRHVYWYGMDLGSPESPLTYPFCSARWQCGSGAPSWFCGEEFLRAIQQLGYNGNDGCERFLRRPESLRHRAQFAAPSAPRGAMVGESVDINEPGWPTAHRGGTLSLEQIRAAVAVLLARQGSGGDERVLKMALIAWYATRSGIHTLGQLGQWFRCSPTTLRRDIEAHRAARPALFKLSTPQLRALTQPSGP